MIAEHRFASLDALRGVCAVCVALLHYVILLPNHFVGIHFFTHTWLFVDFFFVLSGFVISHAYFQRLDNTNELASFLIKRIGRLWPLHKAILGYFFFINGMKYAWEHRHSRSRRLHSNICNIK